jgi:hypothetical protein
MDNINPLALENTDSIEFLDLVIQDIMSRGRALHKGIP